MDTIYQHGFFQALAQEKAVRQLFEYHSKLGLPEGNTNDLHGILAKNIDEPKVADLSIAAMRARSHEEQRKLLVALLTSHANPLAIPVLASGTLILRELGVTRRTFDVFFEKSFEGRIKFDADDNFEDTKSYPVLMVQGKVSKNGTTRLSCTGHSNEEAAQRASKQSDDDDDILTVIVRPGGGGFWNWLKNGLSNLFGGGGGKQAVLDPILAAMMDIMNAANEGAQTGAFWGGVTIGFGGLVIGGVIGSAGGPAGTASGASTGATVGTAAGVAQGALTGGLVGGMWRAGEIVFDVVTNVVEMPDGRSDSESTIPAGFPGLGPRQSSRLDAA